MATVIPGYTGINYSDKRTIMGVKIDLNDLKIQDIKTIILYGNDILEDFIKQIDSIQEKSDVVGQFIDISKNLIKSNVDSNKDLLANGELKSIQFEKILCNIYRDFYYFIEQLPTVDTFNNIETIKYYTNEISLIYQKILNIPQLNMFSDTKKKGILLIGKNGSGKSSFASLLKDVYSDEMIIIPASKLLIYDTSIQDIHNKDKNDINMMQQENLTKQLRFEYQSINVYSLYSNFSSLITAIANITMKEQNEYINNLKDQKNYFKHETTLDQLNSIFSKLLKKTRFDLNPTEHTIEPIDETNNSYSINLLSDGERALLYYIGNVLLAQQNSYIVIDEPESHLNPAIYNTLWNILEDLRSDCQFIYISHEINFITSRNNMDLIWIKNYTYPNTWEYELITDNYNLPKELLIEVLGCEKKILFCEGAINSFDYKIYSALFDDEYSVIPVGGWHEVCKYTKIINSDKNLLLNTSAIGLIDYDNRSKSEIENLMKENIYATEFNEIEMLLCDELVIKKVVDLFDDKTAKTSIDKFKKAFINTISNDKEKIAYTYIRNEINYYINNYNIMSKNFDGVADEIKNIINFPDFEKKYELFKETINTYLEHNDYQKLLKICNLKNKIVKELGDTYLNKNYCEQAIGAIRKYLVTDMRKKYFKNIK